jgi:hypothetical protein
VAVEELPATVDKMPPDLRFAGERFEATTYDAEQNYHWVSDEKLTRLGLAAQSRSWDAFTISLGVVIGFSQNVFACLNALIYPAVFVATTWDMVAALLAIVALGTGAACFMHSKSDKSEITTILEEIRDRPMVKRPIP